MIYRKDCFFLGSSKDVQREPPEVFYKKGVLKNSAILTEKSLCWCPCDFIKKVLHRRCFPVNVADILRTTFLTVCSYHVTYSFQSGSALCSCLNVKELLARDRRDILSLSDCNGTGTHNHFVHKRRLKISGRVVLEVEAKNISQW